MGSLAEVQLTLVDTLDDLFDLKEWMGRNRDRLAIDLETTGVNVGRDRVRLAQVGDRDHGWAMFYPEWKGAFKELVEAYDRPIYTNNAIFEATFLKRDGIKLRQDLLEDVMVMAHLNASGHGIGLKPLAKRYVDRKAVAAEAVKDEAMKRQGWDWATVPRDFHPYWMYGGLDPVLTCRVAEKIEPQVLPRFKRSYEIEMGAIHAFRDARLNGMRVDTDYAQRMSAELGAEMATIEPELPINPGSPKQLVEWLQAQGATLFKTTPKGNPSVDDEVLKYWEQTIPDCAKVRRYRYCQKLKSSYFDNLLRHQVGGIVHPDMRVLGAEKTGRMSITAPALQTLPKSAIGRNAFIAREGCTLIAADFSGIEMRLMAHMSQDPNMIERYHEGVDLHTWTAQQVFHTEEPTKKQRAVAKAAGFAKIYGAGVPKFALTSGLSEPEAEQFLHRYDELFPRVREFQERVIRDVRACDGKKWGHVYTEFGRRLMVEKEEAYKGVNYRDQGSAGEVLKLKACELVNAGLGDFIRLPVHDEFIFEVPDEDVGEVTAEIERVMPEHQLFRVPLTVEVENAKRWGDLYE